MRGSFRGLFFPIFFLLFACGGGSNPGSSTTVTITGSASFSSAESNLSVPNFNTNFAESSAPAGSTVTIVKMSPDGTEESVATGTIGSDGSFSISNLPVAQTGSGASTDFYYEARITNGDDEVRCPFAPSEDMSITADLDCDLASRILSSAVEVEGTKPPVDADIINNLKAQVSNDMTNTYEDNTTLPSSSQSSQKTALAEGVTTGGGNAQSAFSVSQLATERLQLVGSSDTTQAQWEKYLSRLNYFLCSGGFHGESTEGSLESSLAAKVIAGQKYTPSQVITAYNEATGSSLTTETEVSDFVEKLSTAESALESETSGVSSGDNEFFLMVRATGLKSSTFTSSTELDADQVILFIMSLPDTLCEFTTPTTLPEVIANLFSDSSVEASKIEGVEIYAMSGFGCSDGEGEGAFNGTVYVLVAGGLTLSSVVVTSSDATALSSGTATLDDCGQASCSKSSTEASPLCVALDTEVTYTVTATFSDASTDEVTVTRTHPLVSETNTMYGGTELPNTGGAPTAISDKLPLFTWTAPDEKRTGIGTANPTNGVPSGSKVKYSYEFSHCDTSSSCGSPLSGCDSESALNNLYAVDNFIPTKKCDPEACSISSGIDAANIACRINLQTFLVDEYDSIIGQAAGNFRYYCYDADGDGSC